MRIPGGAVITNTTVVGNEAIGGNNAQGFGGLAAGGGIIVGGATNNSTFAPTVPIWCSAAARCPAIPLSGARAARASGAALAWAAASPMRAIRMLATNLNLAGNTAIGGTGGAGGVGGGGFGGGIGLAFDTAAVSITGASLTGNLAQGGPGGSGANGGNGEGGAIGVGGGVFWAAQFGTVDSSVGHAELGRDDRQSGAGWQRRHGSNRRQRPGRRPVRRERQHGLAPERADYRPTVPTVLRGTAAAVKPARDWAAASMLPRERR